MQTLLKEKVNVSAIFRSFRDSSEKSRTGWEHKRIEPRALKRKKGEALKIVGSAGLWPAKRKRLQVHFVIRCENDRYFHLVYDADKIIWILLNESDDQLLFDEINIEAEVNRDALS